METIRRLLQQIRDALNQAMNRPRTEAEERFDRFIDWVTRFCDRLGTALFRLLILGLILTVVGEAFPEVREKFPTIFAFYEGGAHLVEWLVNYSFRGIYAFFTGHFMEVTHDFYEELGELIKTFTTWISQL